jgi:hypothetical protein
MPEMTTGELNTARELLEHIQQLIGNASHGDPTFSLRLYSYIARKLKQNERGTPAKRNKLKKQKLEDQKQQCVYEKCPVPGKKLSLAEEPVLHRIGLDPLKRYTRENTILIHRDCHTRLHAETGWH